MLSVMGFIFERFAAVMEEPLLARTYLREIGFFRFFLIRWVDLLRICSHSAILTSPSFAASVSHFMSLRFGISQILY